MNRRKLPKLHSCLTKISLENLRNRELFTLDVLDAKGIRRIKLPLHECIVLEMKEAGFTESASYMQDLIYDNQQLVEEDDLGIVTDLRKKPDYLHTLGAKLEQAEKEHDRGRTNKEAIQLLELAMFFSEKEKGIFWLAEKLFLASIAVASQYLLDGGRQKCVCKYYYAKFLLDKFPDLDDEEPSLVLTEVRDACIGKGWNLQEEDYEGPFDSLFGVAALQLNRVLMNKARKCRTTDTPKAERLARLAERRAKDAKDEIREAEAIIEIGICQLLMKNLNNSQKTFGRALKIHTNNNNIEGICETKMHLSAVMQKLGDHEMASKLLTDMGMLAMQKGLRRQLGRALHLLGELHLRRERPELGTQHLSEAFMCFMGFSFNAIKSEIANETVEKKEDVDDGTIEEVYESEKKIIYEEEAEQSRFMTAISAGQELMASYFNLLYQARTCTVAQIKVIEWKLDKYSWWVQRRHHNFVPCLCTTHNRTPLDVLVARQQESAMAREAVDSIVDVDRTNTTVDITKLHSGFISTVFQ